MRRKHNPWVALVALLLLVTLLVTVCTGCNATEAEAEETERFTIENVGGIMCAYAYILTDNETGVQYLYVNGGEGGGLIVLQPAPAEEVLPHG